MAGEKRRVGYSQLSNTPPFVGLIAAGVYECAERTGGQHDLRILGDCVV